MPLSNNYSKCELSQDPRSQDGLRPTLTLVSLDFEVEQQAWALRLAVTLELSIPVKVNINTIKWHLTELC